MEIRELVDKTFKLKILRNHLEIIIEDLNDECQKEKDNKDRCGLPFDADMRSVDDSLSTLHYALKQLNEGISYLEAAHRRSIRYKEPTEEKPKQEKKGE